MPTGWRPDDVKDKYPRFVTKDINNRKNINYIIHSI